MAASTAADGTRNLVDETMVDVLIVAAMAIELEPLRLRLSDRRVERGAFRVDVGILEGRRVALVESRPGEANAVRAIEVASQVFRTEVLMSIGLAGGLADELTVGDVVIADRVLRFQSEKRFEVDGDNPPIEVATGISSDLSKRRYVGTLVTVERAMLKENEKRKLAEATQAVAVEMETYAIARWCIEHKKQLIAVRSISDAVGDTLPSVVHSLIGANPFEQIGRVAGTLVRRPSVLKQLWQLRSRASAAADRLGEEVVTIVAGLQD